MLGDGIFRLLLVGKDTTNSQTDKNNKTKTDKISSEKGIQDVGKKNSIRENRDTTQETLTEEDKALTSALIDVMQSSNGKLEVITDEQWANEIIDRENERGNIQEDKRKTPETVSLSNKKGHQAVISSVENAKVVKNLDTLTKEYQNSTTTDEKTFIGKVAQALNISDKFKGKSSQYATFETKNGNIITIRLSNHNAKVSNFDNHNETDGISIVITSKRNGEITNDGTSHVVEYYYNSIKLRKAQGKPLADIVRSIQQALYSGEFTDTTGLAEKQEVNIQFFKTSKGECYGFTVGGKIYIDTRIAKADTPIHEITHLWARALRENNPKEWKNIVALMKNRQKIQQILKLTLQTLLQDVESSKEKGKKLFVKIITDNNLTITDFIKIITDFILTITDFILTNSEKNLMNSEDDLGNSDIVFKGSDIRKKRARKKKMLI